MKCLKDVENTLREIIGKSIENDEEKVIHHEADMKRLEKELEVINDEIEKEHEIIKELKEKIQKAAADKINENERKNKEIVDGMIARYSDRLGLRIRKITPYSLEFSFVKLDFNGTKHVIVLYLDGDNSYQVRECIPLVDDLEELICQLNHTNDISIFLIGLYKSFQALSKPS